MVWKLTLAAMIGHCELVAGFRETHERFPLGASTLCFLSGGNHKLPTFSGNVKLLGSALVSAKEFQSKRSDTP